MIVSFRFNHLERSVRRFAVAAVVLLNAGPAGAGEPGASLLAELFPAGLPVPFEAVVDRLRSEAGAANVQVALVPLGRSLQRYAARPGLFRRAADRRRGDRRCGRGAGGPRLADRLFLGYAPAAEVIEAISYDEAAGRFVFEEVVGYGDAGRGDRAGRAAGLPAAAIRGRARSSPARSGPRPTPTR